MTIGEFIEAAIKGGWGEKYTHYPEFKIEDWGITYNIRDCGGDTGIHEILLDPIAWQAVGKVEGWGNAELFMDDYTNNHPFMGGTIDYPYQEGAGMTYEAPGWIYRMHRMVDALAEGKTIEEYLSTL